ncbi:MAG: NAD(+) synthase [Clostridiales bacterium]|nr:NAD(+) synthase [Clostridiales bacterium]
MKDGFVKVAAGTPEIRIADCEHNADAVIAVIRRAEADGVKVLVLPELTIVGYTSGDLVLSTALTDRAMLALERITRATGGSDMLVAIGVPIVFGHLLYNCAAVVQNGRVLGVIPKTHLGNYGEFYEKRTYAAALDTIEEMELFGQKAPFGNRLVFCCREMPLFNVGVEICEDLWAAVPPSTLLADCGANILLNLSASDEAVTKVDYRRMLVQSQSSRTNSAYVFCSAGDGESTTDVVFSGHDMISENGVLLAEAKPFGAGYCASEVDLEFLSRERRRFARKLFDNTDILRIPFSMDVSETKLTRIFWKTPFVPDVPESAATRFEQVLAIQSHGLKQRIKHTSAKKLLIGVSGGVDSTLALIIAKEALALLGRPAEDVVAVTMPCFGTSSRTRGNAEKLCDALGISMREIQIGDSVKQHLADIGHPLELHDAAYENAQARERTQVLMDLANMYNGLVIGTGDLSELALGFATFNGDHMSSYGVNADVPKTLIRAMLRYIAGKSDAALRDVLIDIVDTPVSPELLPTKDGAIAQVTEDLIGPYELHDFFLYHMIRRGAGKGKILRLAKYAFDGDYDDATIEKWYALFIRRFFSQQFKRNCIPDGPRIGNVALSPRGDWRMPSDAQPSAFQ